MNKELQQSKLRLSIGSNSNSFENINKSSIKKVREQRKCQPLNNLNLNNDVVSQDDTERVIKADELFEKYFPKKNRIVILFINSI